VADRWKSTTWTSESTFHRKWLYTYTQGSQAANQILNKGNHKTPFWVTQTYAQQLGGLLANMMSLSIHQRHDVNVDTNILKACLPEQIKHCGERLLAQIYTVDRYQRLHEIHCLNTWSIRRAAI